MFGRYRKYFYRINRRLGKMLLVKESLEIELRDSIIAQIDTSVSLKEDPSVNDEAKVHELRKAVKRSRALLKLLKPALDDTSYYTMDEILGNSARLLTDQREATVNLRTFINLTTNRKDILSTELRNTVLKGLTEQINQSYNLGQTNFSNQLQNSIVSLIAAKEKILNLPLNAINEKNLSVLMRKTYQKAARLFHDARFSFDTEIIHKWRKYSKHLLFQLKLSPLRNGMMMQQFVRLLERLSDQLGDEHDLAVLENYLLNTFDLTKEYQQQIHLIVAKERMRLQNEAFKLGAKLFA